MTAKPGRGGSEGDVAAYRFPFSHTSALPLGSVDQGVKGCEECNRSGPKPWPIFTVNYHGEEVCAKCLTPMRYTRI